MFINTNLFSEDAAYFKKYGRYCDEPDGSPGYYEYWDERLRRCTEGYSIGGVKITGLHYAYLNFAQIKLRNKEAKGIAKGKIKKQMHFPDFWDSDYNYFWELEIAQCGWSGPCGIPTANHYLVGLTELELDIVAPGGEHMIVLKKRRWGASYKNAFMAAIKFATEVQSTTILGAFHESFLIEGRGTMNMAVDYLDFFNEHVPIFRQPRLTDRIGEKLAGYYEEEEGSGIWIPKGIASRLLAVTFKDNPDAARGKDGDLIMFEEAGKFPNLENSYLTTKLSVTSGIYQTGFIIIFGTGGGKDSNWKDFEKMYYDPKTYGLRAYKNEWDEGAGDGKVGYFVPEYLSKDGFIDRWGNSVIENPTPEQVEDTGMVLGAKEWDLAHVDNLQKTAKDSSVVTKYLAEQPHSPRHAFMRVGSNSFPTKLLNDQLNRVLTDERYDIGKYGYMEEVPNEPYGVRFIEDRDRKPIYHFPHKDSDDLEGAVVIYYPPEFVIDTNGQRRIPDGLYYGFHDPYNKSDAISKESLGTFYILKAVDRSLVGSEGLDLGDICVASWVARPDDVEDYNIQMFMLARMYNAMIGFENNTGQVIPDAKLHDATHLLEPQFSLTWEDSLEKSKANAKFGINMDENKKLLGEGYLKKWLLTKRYFDEAENRWIYNLDTIYDPAFLMELMKFFQKGNFDRVSAWFVGMFYQKERIYKGINEINKQYEEDTNSFFSSNRKFFQRH